MPFKPVSVWRWEAPVAATFPRASSCSSSGLLLTVWWPDESPGNPQMTTCRPSVGIYGPVPFIGSSESSLSVFFSLLSRGRLQILSSWWSFRVLALCRCHRRGTPSIFSPETKQVPCNFICIYLSFILFIYYFKIGSHCESLPGLELSA